MKPQRSMRHLIAAALLGTTMLSGVVLAQDQPQPQNQNISPVTRDAGQGLPGSFADLVQQVSPAVVTISAEQKVAADGPASVLPEFQFPPGSPFEELFKQFQQPEGRRPEPRKGVSMGSGFIIDADGSIVTNNHVVDGADKVTVTLQDGTSLKAKIVGRDEKTDLALLKVDGHEPLPYLQWGDSDTARVGDWVLAVGNPFGLGGSVTTGIISARARDIRSGPYDDFLQIDASINRGNSGGPTFDMQGKVIGINTAIFSPNGGSVGIGFAIPSNMAKTVIAQLRDHGSVERGWLGVQIQPVTPEIAESLGLREPKGALVASLMPDSPAVAAGLKTGDVVVGFDGKPVGSARDLSRIVADSRTGAGLPMTILRDGKTQTVKVTLQKQPQEPRQVAASAERPSADTVLGMHLARLDGQARRQLGLSDDVQGVVVTDLAGDAGDLPIRPGDVITAAGNDSVKSPADIAAKVQEAKKAGRNAVLLRINRQGAEQFVAVPIRKA
jgi:serine protease Do